MHKRPDVFTVAGSMKNSKTPSASWLLRANVRNCSNEELAFLAKRALAAKPNDKFCKLDISDYIEDGEQEDMIDTPDPIANVRTQ